MEERIKEMPWTCDASQFVELSGYYPVVDVRSPAEFAQGHFDSAVNVPLFDNDERSRIGTLYVQTGRQPAIRQGFEIAGKKFDRFFSEIQALVSGNRFLLHCWRGGMRSESMAWFYRQSGYEVSVLQGGYKALRKHIRASFSGPQPLIMLGGMTGTGKSEILRNLAEKGKQVIDLEGLANHKGSSFGHLGFTGQPTTEQFENTLFTFWNRSDPTRPLFLEHESNRIGSVFLPDTFYSAMLNSTLIFLDVPVKERIRRIVKEYAGFDHSLLTDALANIRTGMGTQAYKDAIEALSQEDYEKVAELTLVYYDKTYSHGLKLRPVRNMMRLATASGDAEVNATMILDFLKKNNLDK